MKFILDLIFRWRHSKHEVIKNKIKDAKIILEIGSHLGTDTVKLRESFPKAKIFCFEPDPRSQAIFTKYHKSLGATLVPLAISDRNQDETDFFLAYSKEMDEHTINKFSWLEPKEVVAGKLSRCSASSLKFGHSALDNADVVKVKTARLDDWVLDNNIGSIDLIWMDVQGAEKEVFDGARDTLKKTRYIWSEYGEMDYEGGLSWSETKKCLSPLFRVVNVESAFRRKGDLFLENKEKV